LASFVSIWKIHSTVTISFAVERHDNMSCKTLCCLIAELSILYWWRLNRGLANRTAQLYQPCLPWKEATIQIWWYEEYYTKYRIIRKMQKRNQKETASSVFCLCYNQAGPI
jgi:hypothetical protein